jgi:hypothetical protein
MHYFSVGYQGTVRELNRNSYFSVLGHPSNFSGFFYSSADVSFHLNRFIEMDIGKTE